MGTVGERQVYSINTVGSSVGNPVIDENGRRRDRDNGCNDDRRGRRRLERIFIPRLLGAMHAEAEVGTMGEMGIGPGVQGLVVHPAETPNMTEPAKWVHNKEGISMSGVHTRWVIQQGLAYEFSSAPVTTRKPTTSTTLLRIVRKMSGKNNTGHHGFDINPLHGPTVPVDTLPPRLLSLSIVDCGRSAPS